MEQMIEVVCINNNGAILDTIFCNWFVIFIIFMLFISLLRHQELKESNLTLYSLYITKENISSLITSL